MLKLSALNSNSAGGILTPSHADFKRDLLPLVDQILDENRIRYRYHKTNKTFHFPWSKYPVYCFSAERPIAGPNLGYCLINEFSLIAKDRLSEMLRRVRVKSAKFPQKILVGTPEDVNGFVEEFVESQEKLGPDKFKIHYTSTDENVHVSESYAESLSALLDESQLEIFRFGKFGRLGTDYFYYSFDRDKNVSENAVYDKDLIIHCSLDFNVGRVSAAFSHTIGDKQYFFDELVLRGDSSTYTMATALKELYPQDMILITCDASGAARKTVGVANLMSDVTILKSEGFNVRYRTQNPRLRKRQLLMNGMMFHGRIVINPKCKLLIRDFKSGKQKADFTKDEGKDGSFSHLSDGADYICDFEHQLNLERRNVSRVLR